MYTDCNLLCYASRNFFCSISVVISVQGFYAVYGDVFRRIASEEAQYREAGRGDDEQLPEFGMPVLMVPLI